MGLAEIKNALPDPFPASRAKINNWLYRFPSRALARKLINNVPGSRTMPEKKILLIFSSLPARLLRTNDAADSLSKIWLGTYPWL